MKKTMRLVGWMLLLALLTTLCWGCTSHGSEAAAQTAAEPSIPPRYQPTAPTQPPRPRTKKNPEWVGDGDYNADKTAYVVFKLEKEQKYVYVSRDYILNYESKYPECNGSWFRDRLNEEAQCIYNCYLYALENQMSWFELYVEDNDRDFHYIREAFSLGSPFMEQNINRYGEYATDRPNDHLGEKLWIYIPQFVEKRWDMRLEAYEKCKEIVAGIPAEYTTQEEKMEYLYRYVCDHVEYVMYENMADEDHLYDAVCRGEAVCDGYSNMLNMLFCLIGVESYEAMGSNYEDLTQLTPEELAEAMGHTWVVAKLGEHFYNFDPTFEDTREDGGDNLLYFGFSDDLLSVKYLDCEDLRPQCLDTSRDSRFADIVVENRESNDEIRAAALEMDYRMDDDIRDTTLLIRDLTTEKQIYGFMDRLIGKTQKLARQVTIEIMYLRGAALVTVHGEPR